MTQQYTSDWSDAAKQYQSTVGAVSAQAAFELISMATTLSALTPDTPVLDAGCGPGPVTLAILAQTPATPIEAIDTSPKMRDDLAANVERAGLSAAKLSTNATDIHEIVSTYGAAAFSHVFASFVIHVATKDFAAHVQDIYQVLKPGGVFAIATFTPHADPYVIWDRVCRIYDPEYVQASYSLDPRAWASPGQVAGGLQITGFVDIKSVLRRAPFPIQTADGWADFWFDGKNPAGEAVVRPFFETHDLEVAVVKETYRQIVQDEWDGGKNVHVEFVLAVGRKP